MKKKIRSHVLSALVLIALPLPSFGQEEDPFAADPAKGKGGDPFADVNDYSKVFRKGAASDVLTAQTPEAVIMLELIEVDHLIANELMLEHGKNANDAGEMREELFAYIKAKKAALKDSLWSRSPLNQKIIVTDTVEKIYPTEYEPPALPSVIASKETGVKSNKSSTTTTVPAHSGNYTSATPTAFDTKLVGTTLEFEIAQSSQHPNELGLSIDLSIVRFLGWDKYVPEEMKEITRGVEHIVMPRFTSTNRHFLAKVTPGKHSLLGIYQEEGSSDKRVIILLRTEVIAKK